MAGLRFNPEVTWTHILAAVGLIIGGFTAYTAINSAIATLTAVDSAMTLRITAIENNDKTYRDMTYRLAAIENWRPTVDHALERGRLERIEFQKETAEIQRQILEKLSSISADLAVIKSGGRPTN